MNKLAATPQINPGIKQDYNYRAPGYTKEDEMNYQTLLNRYAARYEAIRRDKSLKAHERTQQGAFLRMLNEIQNDPSKHQIAISDLSRVSPYSPMTTVTMSNGQQRSGVDRRHTILTDLHRLTMGSDMRDKVDESPWWDIFNIHAGSDKYRTPSARAYEGIKEGRRPGEAISGEGAFHFDHGMKSALSNTGVGMLFNLWNDRINRPTYHYLHSLFTDPKNASIKKSWDWGARQHELHNKYVDEAGNYAAYTMPLLTEQGKSDAAWRRGLQRAGASVGLVGGEALDLLALRGAGTALKQGATASGNVIRSLRHLPKTPIPKGSMNGVFQDTLDFFLHPVNRFKRQGWGGRAMDLLIGAGYLSNAYDNLVSMPGQYDLDAAELQRGVGNYDQTFVPGKDNKSISDLLISHPEIARQLTDYTTNARTGMINPYAGSYEDNSASWRNMRGVNGSKLGLSPIFKYYNTINNQNRDIDERASKIDEIASRVADVTPKDGKPVSLAQRNLLKSRQRELNRATREYSRKVNSYGHFRRDNYDNMLKGREIR